VRIQSKKKIRKKNDVGSFAHERGLVHGMKILHMRGKASQKKIIHSISYP